MREIVITFEEDGSAAKIEAVGFKGKGCHAATKPYEQVLLVGAVEDVKKPEHYQTEQGGKLGASR